MNGSMLHSTRSQANQNQRSESDRDFWENVPNPVDIERERLRGQAEAVAATQHMTNNNLQAFREDSRFAARRVEQHAIPELPDITPIPDTMVNSGPDVEAFPQELMSYTEEISSQKYPQWYILKEIIVKTCLQGYPEVAKLTRTCKTC